MRGEVQFHVAPKPGRRGCVESRILPKTSCLLVTLAASTTTIRTMAQILPEPCFGSAWTAFRPNNRIARPDEAMQAWCAYLNSTLGVLSYLHRRARKLTYGRYRRRFHCYKRRMEIIFLIVVAGLLGLAFGR